eukprot:1219540-Pyramimonas_sp.AAC.1
MHEAPKGHEEGGPRARRGPKRPPRARGREAPPRARRREATRRRASQLERSLASLRLSNYLAEGHGSMKPGTEVASQPKPRGLRHWGGQPAEA